MKPTPRRMLTSLPALAFTAALAAAHSAAHAQWTYTVLSQSPARDAGAAAAHGGQHVGYARASAAGDTHAMLWLDSGAAIDLHPAGAVQSRAYGASNGWQVGVTTRNDSSHACLWNGTAESWVSLHGPMHGWNNSAAYGVHGGQQVGRTNAGTLARAALWFGTAESYVSLHPPGAGWSEAHAVHAGQQVGFAAFNGAAHAYLWHGPSGPRRDLHPAGATRSYAHGVWNGEQVGVAWFNGIRHGGIWRGAASSWVSLGPGTHAYATHGGYQAGHIESGIMPERFSACIWQGAPESREDLSAVLSSHYHTSTAYGIWNDGETLYVVGTAAVLTPDGFVSNSDAILWTRPIPCPAEWNRDGVVNSNDISDFLAAWLDSVANGTFDGDFNHDESVDSTDIARFLSRWINDVASGGC